ncbi:MAG: transposase [Candidatus Sulfotelmatobacter sp.]
MVLGSRVGRFPLRVQSILQQSLRLRARCHQQQISPRGLAVARGRLEAAMDRLLQTDYRRAENRRLANHLRREQDVLFSFLHCPGLDATNWRAEQAIRPMVVTRKVLGGNRTPAGARTQSILVSILQTCRQQRRRSTQVLQQLLCSPQSKILDLTAPTR